MKTNKRAARRAHYDRMKDHCRKNIPWMSADQATKFADNRKPCSCWMCGNQRKHHGEPFAETKKKTYGLEMEQ
jgi:hypothetical protein